MESGVNFRIGSTQRICEGCGNLVSKTAQSCPKCGYSAPPDKKGKGTKEQGWCDNRRFDCFAVGLCVFLTTRGLRFK